MFRRVRLRDLANHILPCQTVSQLPTPPTGQSKFAVLMRRIYDAVLANRIASVVGGEIKRSSSGVQLIIKPGKTTGTSTGLTLRGEYVPGTSYNKDEMVVIFSGASQGTYVCLVDGTTTAPQNGTKWISLPMGSSVGAWT